MLTRDLKKADGWKCINPTKKHNSMTYEVGKVNEDVLPFHPKGSCQPGGLYYTDIKHIIQFLYFAVKDGKLGSVHPVYLCKDSKVYKDFGGFKWKTNKFFLGEGFDLNNPETYQMLIGLGADINSNDNQSLILASERGHIEVVKLLLCAGANANAQDNEAFRLASYKGHTKIVELLNDFSKIEYNDFN